jgi:manganese/zinc/iron transport system permease protein
VLRFYKELKLATFDPGLAAALGFSPVLIHYLLMAVVSMTTVAAFDSVGAILVVALLIVPPAAAYLLTDRLAVMLGLSAGLGALSAVLGYLMARAVDGSIAGAMATSAGLIFIVAFLVSPRHGALAWLARQARLRRRFAADMLVLHLAQHGLDEEGQTAGAHAGRPVSAPSAPTGDPESLPGAALQERFRWSPSFTRSVVQEALAEGLVRTAEPDAGVQQPPPKDLESLVITLRGRARAAEILAA